MRLSVLDQSPIPAGATPEEALRNTLDLAQHADVLGYTRYWLAEHHNSRALAGPAPEILAAAVAERTRRIRVGSGGVMLTHYAPLKVAEGFRVLCALHPGRIDLGVGRAPGSDAFTAHALRPDADANAFPGQVRQLLAFLADGRGPIRATPDSATVPEVWLLGSSEYGAAVAAELGTAFSFAHFINPEAGLDAVRGYRERFVASDALGTPMVSVGVSVVCADDAAEAERLAASVRVWSRRLRAGDPGPFPSVEEALAALEGVPRSPDPARRLIAGDPMTVRDELIALRDTYDADELVLLTLTHDHEARRRSYRLIAEAFGLTAASGRPPRECASPTS